MREELISIIIPVYHVENYISRCLESVIHQTYKNLEIIIIDDGTKDNSGIIAEEYAKLDNRIKVIHKENEGLGLTRNVGIQMATGKYIAFLDSDDYIELTMYEKMYNAMIQNQLDAVICDFKRLSKEENFSYHCANLRNQTYEKDKIKDEILPSICGSKKNKMLIGSAWCVLYKKEIIDKYHIRFFNEREFVSEDLIFNLNYFSKCNKIQILEEDLYIYCENDGSLTKNYNPDKTKKFKNLYSAMKEQIENEDKECYFGLHTLYIENMRVAIIQEITMNPNKKEIPKNVKNICEDKLLCEILGKYSIKYLTSKQKIFTLLMKYKLVNLIMLVTKHK